MAARAAYLAPGCPLAPGVEGWVRDGYFLTVWHPRWLGEGALKHIRENGTRLFRLKEPKWVVGPDRKMHQE